MERQGSAQALGSAPPPRKTWLRRWTPRMNFYRIHLLYFIAVILIAATIMWLCTVKSDDFQLAYIDSLFITTSAMTQTGLTTVNLSALQGIQQVIIFILMIIGNPIIISWFTVLFRRRYFTMKFQHLLRHSKKARRRIGVKSLPRIVSIQPSIVGRKIVGRLERFSQVPSFFSSKSSSVSRRGTQTATTTKSQPHENAHGHLQGDPDDAERGDATPMGPNFVGPPRPAHHVSKESKRPKTKALRNVQITRVDTPPQHITNSGWISRQEASAASDDREKAAVDAEAPATETSPHSEPTNPLSPILRSSGRDNMPRSLTVEFREPQRGSHAIEDDGNAIFNRRRRRRDSSASGRSINSHESSPGLGRRQRSMTGRTQTRPQTESGFGGFPGPVQVFRGIYDNRDRILPRTFTKNLSIDRTPSLASQRAMTRRPTTRSASTHTARPPPRENDEEASDVTDYDSDEAPLPEYHQPSYFSFVPALRRNSAFINLTAAQKEELGGVEYRALEVLVWFLPTYWLVIQLLGLVIIAPWIYSDENYASVITAQPGNTNLFWFSYFQVMASITDTGLSLVDAGMVPFQAAYVLVLTQAVIIAAGYTFAPVMMRFMLWLMYKASPVGSRFKSTLKFLLDHPRRLVYILFPSSSTWILFTVLMVLTSIDWVAFLVLDIGNDVIEEIPLNIRFMDGLFQSLGIRTAGFAVVPLASVSPALQVLFLIMMYISAYPLAISIRSTNVYEEKSLGLYQVEETDEQIAERTGAGYTSVHLRRQLSFDIWWLFLALWLIAIIERAQIIGNQLWFNLWSIIFEIVSAYGNVGLSLGVPFDFYALTGVFHTLSKLIIIFVIIRGRHRGLPMAIDRAILLPDEIQRHHEEEQERRKSLSLRRRSEPDLARLGSLGGMGRTPTMDGSGMDPKETLTEEPSRFSDPDHGQDFKLADADVSQSQTSDDGKESSPTTSSEKTFSIPENDEGSARHDPRTGDGEAPPTGGTTHHDSLSTSLSHDSRTMQKLKQWTKGDPDHPEAPHADDTHQELREKKQTLMAKMARENHPEDPIAVEADMGLLCDPECTREEREHALKSGD